MGSRWPAPQEAGVGCGGVGCEAAEWGGVPAAPLPPRTLLTKRSPVTTAAWTASRGNNAHPATLRQATRATPRAGIAGTGHAGHAGQWAAAAGWGVVLADPVGMESRLQRQYRGVCRSGSEGSAVGLQWSRARASIGCRYRSPCVSSTHGMARPHQPALALAQPSLPVAAFAPPRPPWPSLA